MHGTILKNVFEIGAYGVTDPGGTDIFFFSK
jgi:hypothetical protein